MANAQHVAILKQGVTAWNDWQMQYGHGLPDLSGADFSGADLVHADLVSVNLAGANLTGANLQSATLGEADLTGTVLAEADLSGANLAWTKLGEADLSRALLAGANLTRAFCQATRFVDLDLSAVKGLDTINHQGPSSLPMATLCRSQGKLPEVFLRGCGVPESLIACLPDLLKDSLPCEARLISYSPADEAFARRLHEALQARGIACCLDASPLDSTLQFWDTVLLCCSQQQPHSDLLNSTIIPLDLDGTVADRARVAADFQGWDSDDSVFEHAVEQLIAALDS